MPAATTTPATGRPAFPAGLVSATRPAAPLLASSRPATSWLGLRLCRQGALRVESRRSSRAKLSRGSRRQATRRIRLGDLGSFAFGGSLGSLGGSSRLRSCLSLVLSFQGGNQPRIFLLGLDALQRLALGLVPLLLLRHVPAGRTEGVHEVRNQIKNAGCAVLAAGRQLLMQGKPRRLA